MVVEGVEQASRACKTHQGLTLKARFILLRQGDPVHVTSLFQLSGIANDHLCLPKAVVTGTVVKIPFLGRQHQTLHPPHKVPTARLLGFLTKHGRGVTGRSLHGPQSSHA